LIGLGEIRAALDGSWLLLRNRPEGMAFFDQSIHGFWRSFLVILLLVPAFLVSGAAEKRFYFLENLYHPDAFPNEAFWFAQAAGLGLDWVALPLVLAALAVPIGISRRYVPFIVARNWTSLLASVPYLVTYLLFLLGILSPGVTVLLSLTCLLVSVAQKLVDRGLGSGSSHPRASRSPRSRGWAVRAAVRAASSRRRRPNRAAPRHT
jgi:hypothetical protein